MSEETPNVPWIMGTQAAMARVLAVAIVESHGGDWAKMTEARRQSFIKEANSKIKEAIQTKQIVSFVAPWKEPL